MIHFLHAIEIIYHTITTIVLPTNTIEVVVLTNQLKWGSFWHHTSLELHITIYFNINGISNNSNDIFIPLTLLVFSPLYIGFYSLNGFFGSVIL